MHGFTKVPICWQNKIVLDNNSSKTVGRLLYIKNAIYLRQFVYEISFHPTIISPNVGTPDLIKSSAFHGQPSNLYEQKN